MSDYVYEDIVRLELSEPYLSEFIRSLDSITVLNNNLIPYFSEDSPDRDRYNITMARALFEVTKMAYRHRNEYKVAASSRDKAVAAMLGPPDSCPKDILDLWLKVANKMSKFEKLMAGWDKI